MMATKERENREIMVWVIMGVWVETRSYLNEPHVFVIQKQHMYNLDRVYRHGLRDRSQ